MWSCGFEPETTDHYDLLNDIHTINQSLKNFSQEQLVNISLIGSEHFTLDIKANILRCTSEFLKATEPSNSVLF